MTKEDYKQEVERQLRSAKLGNVCSIILVVFGLLLSITILLAIIGIPLLIFGIVGCVIEGKKADRLKLELEKMR